MLRERVNRLHFMSQIFAPDTQYVVVRTARQVASVQRPLQAAHLARKPDIWKLACIHLYDGCITLKNLLCVARQRGDVVVGASHVVVVNLP